MNINKIIQADFDNAVAVADVFMPSRPSPPPPPPPMFYDVMCFPPPTAIGAIKLGRQLIKKQRNTDAND